jgi:hypothetical protein
MQRGHSAFVSVKPQGQHGDRKNDGYDKTLGSYYQVFAPEDLKLKSADAVKKLKTDFAGLKKHWNSVTPVKRFHFVMNDKYKGSFPTIESDLAAIKVKHKLEECGSFLAKHLEDELFKLSDDQIIAVVGFTPNPDDIELLDYSILFEVINHIKNYKGNLEPTQLLKAPDFDEKIEFNDLGLQTAALLNAANYQSGSVDEYFSLNSEFTKQELRDTINTMYQTSVAKKFETSDGVTVGDLVFLDLLCSIAPDATHAVRNAALVLMAYFFESCDIFEDPNPTKVH